MTVMKTMMMRMKLTPPFLTQNKMRIKNKPPQPLMHLPLKQLTTQVVSKILLIKAKMMMLILILKSKTKHMIKGMKR